MRRVQLLSLLLCLLSLQAFGQNDTLIGILRDAKLKAVKRYPVVLGRDNPVTVKTDRKGVFKFTEANLNDTLYLFAPKTDIVYKIPVSGYNYLHIQLKKVSFDIDRRYEPDPELREILERERNKILSSNTMGRKEIERSRCQDIFCLLRMMSGVQVQNNTVRIRGIGSVYGGNDPLIIVDGTQMDMSILSTLSVYDLKEIKILKEATIAAESPVTSDTMPLPQISIEDTESENATAAESLKPPASPDISAPSVTRYAEEYAPFRRQDRRERHEGDGRRIAAEAQLPPRC